MLKLVALTRPVRSASSTSRADSSAVMASGFSHTTCLPALRGQRPRAPVVLAGARARVVGAEVWVVGRRAGVALGGVGGERAVRGGLALRGAERTRPGPPPFPGPPNRRRPSLSPTQL